MKRTLNIMAVALVILAALSCEKNSVIPEIEQEDKVIILSATTDNGTTKTSLGTLEDGVYPVLWSENDAIGVINNNKLFKFVLDATDAGTTQGSFICENGEGFDEDAPIKAFYPYEGLNYNTETQAISYTTPATQTYVSGSFCSGAMPMAAYVENSEGTIKFTNLFGIIKLQLAGADEEKLQRVEILSNNAVSGASTLTFDGENTPSLTLANTPNIEQIKVILKNGSSDITLSSTPTDVLIAVPGASHKFSVYIITDKGAYHKTVTNAQSIVAGRVKKMPVLDLSSPSDFPTGKMAYVENGVYLGEGITIDGKTWAPVNCGYEPANGDYKGYPRGKMYQWGRKYGQGYSLEYDATIPTIETGPVSLETAQKIEKSNVFFTASEAYTDWLTTPDNALWNSGTEEAPVKVEANDPCPTGWRVPTITELVNLTENHSDYNLDEYRSLNGYWFSGKTQFEEAEENEKIFLVYAGWRYYDARVFNRNSEGRYQSSSVWGINENHLYFSAGNVWAADYARGISLPVRCIKE